MLLFNFVVKHFSSLLFEVQGNPISTFVYNINLILTIYSLRVYLGITGSLLGVVHSRDQFIYNALAVTISYILKNYPCGSSVGLTDAFKFWMGPQAREGKGMHFKLWLRELWEEMVWTRNVVVLEYERHNTEKTCRVWALPSTELSIFTLDKQFSIRCWAIDRAWTSAKTREAKSVWL